MGSIPILLQLFSPPARKKHTYCNDNEFTGVTKMTASPEIWKGIYIFGFVCLLSMAFGVWLAL